MVPHIYMDPTTCSPNGTNGYVPANQPMVSPQQQQQSSASFPYFYPSSPSTPWIPPSPGATPYFMLPNPHFPCQQLI